MGKETTKGLPLRPTRPIERIPKLKPPYKSAGQTYKAPPPFEPTRSSLGLMRNRTKENLQELIEINNKKSS